MCTNPLHLRNPTKDFRLNDPIYFDVACGDCYECRQNKQNDMFVRVFKQMQYNTSHHINNYFATLTYHPYRRPYFELTLPDGTIYKKFCFCKSDWYTFFDNLRKDLSRKYFVGVKGSGVPSINYFVACEQGSKKGLPHMHLFLGVHESVPAEYLHERCKHFWYGDVMVYDGTNCPENQDVSLVDYKIGDTILDDLGNPLHDRFGLFFPEDVKGTEEDFCGRKQQPFQISKDFEKSSYYVSKYSTKDTYFYQDEYLINYIRFLRDSAKKCYNIYDNEFVEELKQLKQCLPFTCHSQNFGACIIDELVTADYKTTCENIAKGVLIGKRYYRVPFYILRKLFYKIRFVNCDGDDFHICRHFGMKRYIRYDLTPLGEYYNLYIFDDTINKMSQRLKNDYVFALCNHDSGIIRFQKEFAKLDWRFFAEYILCYRNRVIPSLSRHFLTEVQPIEYFLRCDSKIQFQSFAMHLKNVNVNKSFGYEIQLRDLPLLDEILYNRLKIFSNYDNMFDALQKFNLSRKRKHAINKNIQRETLDTYRNKYFGLTNFN